MTIHPPRRGLTAVEVIVALAVVGIILLYVMLAVPRSRETARQTTCQRNMMQIGMALGLYTQGDLPLPEVRYGEASPLAQILSELKQPDFLSLSDRKVVPKPGKVVPGAHPVKGFVCPSDPAGSDGSHAAPISYRAATGDTSEGLNGAFEPGKSAKLSQVEAAKGTGFVAAFSERLIGNDRNNDLAFYSSVPGSIGDTGCPNADPSTRKNDAGASWLLSNWSNTLYQHAMTPNAKPSCVSSDGKSGWMGASSAHAEGAYLLMLDGSAKIYRPSVNPTIWRGLGNMGASAR